MFVVVILDVIFLISFRSLDHGYGPKYLIGCWPYLTVLKFGMLFSVLKLYLRDLVTNTSFKWKKITNISNFVSVFVDSYSLLNSKFMNDLHATFPVILVELNVTYFVVAVVVFFFVAHCLPHFWFCFSHGVIVFPIMRSTRTCHRLKSRDKKWVACIAAAWK